MMTVDQLYGQPAQFTEELEDPESDEYMKAADKLHSFVSI